MRRRTSPLEWFFSLIMLIGVVLAGAFVFNLAACKDCGAQKEEEASFSQPSVVSPAPEPQAPPEPQMISPPSTPPPTPVRAEAAPSCQASPLFDIAARQNAVSLSTLRWAPFRRNEVGWETYAPLIAREIGSACPPVTTNFAEALSHWQRARGIYANGVFRAEDFMTMKSAWQRRRSLMHGGCPPPPPDSMLTWARIEEGYSGKPVQMRTPVLMAYRRMIAAARAESPSLRADPQMLSIFSAYRSPDYDAARCARDRNCDGIVRATCSPHRTGLALDIDVGAAPGFRVDSSDDANRLYQTRTEAYRWLVNNAHRFGFANYPFEPWHWEYIGQTP